MKKPVTKKDLVRLVIYKSVTRGAVGLTALLIWERFINQQGRLSAVRDGAFIVGAMFLCLAWFSYLRTDGVTIHHMLEERKKKRPVRKSYTDIVDFADEHIVNETELEPKEKATCSLFSNLLCGALFLIPALIATVMQQAI